MLTTVNAENNGPLGQAEVRCFININDIVKIKLTPYGLAVLAKSKYPNLKPEKEESGKEVDSCGFLLLPLWQVMDIFGQHLYSSGVIRGIIPFQTDMEIVEEFI